MRAGFIEAADTHQEAEEKRDYWQGQLMTLGFTNHRAKVYLVQHETRKGKGKPYSYWAVFAEEIKKP